jgi:hypothetical protein
VAGALRALADQGRLVMPDLEPAISQLYALLIFPHMVFSGYGTHLDDDLTDRLITSGVDMFLSHYGTRLAWETAAARPQSARQCDRDEPEDRRQSLASSLGAASVPECVGCDALGQQVSNHLT